MGLRRNWKLRFREAGASDIDLAGRILYLRPRVGWLSLRFGGHSRIFLPRKANSTRLKSVVKCQPRSEDHPDGHKVNSQRLVRGHTGGWRSKVAGYKLIVSPFSNISPSPFTLCLSSNAWSPITSILNLPLTVCLETGLGPCLLSDTNGQWWMTMFIIGAAKKSLTINYFIMSGRRR